MSIEIAELVKSDPRRARELYQQHRQLRIRVAREDINEFIELVMRDEFTGNPVKQAPVHMKMQELAEKHNRLIIWSHIESGKTNQISIARTLWRLGRNPNLRVAIVSNTVRQSMKIVRSIANYIEKPGIIHEVFPHMKPGAKWGGMALSIQRKTNAKDPSIQACGTGVGTILGSRLDHVAMDDVLTYDNTLQPNQRNMMWEWYHSTLAGRLTEQASVDIVGTAFHPEDLLHRLAENPAWHWARFPVLDKNTGQLNWKERWPASRIEAKRIELGPHEFARQMLCEARDDNEARFKREWINLCLARGNGKTPAFALATIPNGFRVYTGVDLGVRTRDGADITVLFTIIVHPDETREVLCCESGRWAAKEIIEKIKDTHERFGSIIVVESNAAQDYIRQFITADSAIPIRPFNTGLNKIHPEFGVESLATELANGKWIIPNHGGAMTPEINAWVNELMFYDPNSHTGDRLMASWFAREGSRFKQKKGAKVRLDTLRR